MIRKSTVILLAGMICVLGATSVWAAKYNEAPMLRTMVAAGELPPVEERLPAEPVVIEPVEEIGQYGGTLHSVNTNPTWSECWMVAGVEGMLRIGTDGKSAVSNIAKSYEFSEDGKTLTLHLVKGIKWSDGVPFTADDIMFWYEDVILNDELTPVKPSYWSPGGELMTLEKVDDYTVRLGFASTYPAVITYLAYWGSQQGNFYLPKHHLTQFHPSYTPREELTELAKEEGFEGWWQLFQRNSTPDFGVCEPYYPTLYPYVLKERVAGNQLVERNPYYWKVDPEGNQLPYIDYHYYKLVEGMEMINMEIVSGEVDFDFFHPTLGNYPLYVESAEKGNYRVLSWETGMIAEVGFSLNQTHPDPVKRKIFQDVRFRRALSLALNRDEINEVVAFGMATPCQATFAPTTTAYEESFAKSYAEYDPEKANQFLDEMGLDKRDKAGYRLMPDGKRLLITLEYWPMEGPKTPIAELAKEYWEAIGIQLILKAEERSYWAMRMQSSEHDMTEWHLVNSDIIWPGWPSWCLPIGDISACAWGVEWNMWYVTKGDKGSEPPLIVKRLFELYETTVTSMDKEEVAEAFKELGRLQAENLWTIGTIAFAAKPVIARNNLRNVPEKALVGYSYGFFTPYHQEQLFFEK